MPRFFVSKDRINNSIIEIVEPDSRHIARSLRMAEGDLVTLCDGEGKEYLCKLTRIRDEICTAEIESEIVSKSEPDMEITLFMAFPKGDKLETVIQKAVELGATKIVPFESSRCIKRPKAEKADKQTSRLMRIAEEASKQCGRAKIPTVSLPVSFKEMLSLARSSDLSLLCYENEEGLDIKSALKKTNKPDSVSVIVGSEGGFSQEEVDLATAAGCLSVSLGNRILRCETAPLYALSALSYEYELG